MIGLVLVTHGRLAAEFITAMEHVVGPQEAIAGICIDADDDMEMRRAEIASAIANVDQGKGVIILTDLFGGTPSNLAISLMDGNNDPFKKQDSVSFINMHFGIHLDSIDTDITLWGRNITDERYQRIIFDVPLQEGRLASYPAEPRTVGITIRKAFN